MSDKTTQDSPCHGRDHPPARSAGSRPCAGGPGRNDSAAGDHDAVEPKPGFVRRIIRV